MKLGRNSKEEKIGEFTHSQVKKIAKELNKKLGPEYISYRTGFNMTKIGFVEGWTAINLANQIFGFNGWSSEIKSTTLDYEDISDNKFSLGISCIVRVTLKDGTHREDVGFGSSENQRNKSMAYEKARKEAATDALKRALRQFGNCLGNCCYDKNYLKNVQKVKRENEEIIDATKLLRKNILCDSDPSNKDRSISLDLDNFDISNIGD